MAAVKHITPSLSALESLRVCRRPLSSCRRAFLSPLQRGAFEFLVVSVNAWRAGVQLDKQLREFELREHGLQEAFQEHVHEAPVHGLMLKHVEDAQDALPCGVRSDDVLQLI